MVEKAVVLQAWGCQDPGTSKPLSVCSSFSSVTVIPEEAAKGLQRQVTKSQRRILTAQSWVMGFSWNDQCGQEREVWDLGLAQPGSGDHHQGKGKWVVFLETTKIMCLEGGDQGGVTFTKGHRQSRRTDWSIFFCPLVQSQSRVLCLVLPGCGTKRCFFLPFLFQGNDSFCLNVFVNFKSTNLFLNLWLLISLSYIHPFAYLFPNPTKFNWILCVGGSAPLPLWD